MIKINKLLFALLIVFIHASSHEGSDSWVFAETQSPGRRALTETKSPNDWTIDQRECDPNPRITNIVGQVDVKKNADSVTQTIPMNTCIPRTTGVTNRYYPLKYMSYKCEDHKVEDSKMVVIEQSYEDSNCSVQGRWRRSYKRGVCSGPTTRDKHVIMTWSGKTPCGGISAEPIVTCDPASWKDNVETNHFTADCTGKTAYFASCDVTLVPGYEHGAVYCKRGEYHFIKAVKSVDCKGSFTHWTICDPGSYTNEFGARIPRRTSTGTQSRYYRYTQWASDGGKDCPKRSGSKETRVCSMRWYSGKSSSTNLFVGLSFLFSFIFFL